MGPDRTDTTPQPYRPDQSQYIPPLESWPPQGQATPNYVATAYDFQAPPPPARPSVLLPWLLVGCGLIIPLVALIVGLWAWTRSHSDNRYTAVMFGGIGMFALVFLLNASAAGLL